MRKCIAALLAVTLLFVAFAAHPAAAAADLTYVRVLLSTSDAKKITMTVRGSYTVKESMRIFTDGTLTLTGDGRQVTVTHSAEGVLYQGTSVTIERNNLSRDAGSLRFVTKYGTRFYLGHFTITSSNSILRVINRVPMSHYLYGVVGHEMADSWPLEALKAQAIAAKCYALLRLGNTRAYDLNDTSSHQVYKGYTPTNQNVIQAVDDTQSQALYYNGSVMRCYYAASNGGYMIRPSTTWTGPIEPWDAAYAEGYDAYDAKNPLSLHETLFVPVTFAERKMNARLYKLLSDRFAAAATAPGAVPDGYTYMSVLRIDSITSTDEAGAADGIDHAFARVDGTVIAAINTIPATPTPAVAPTPTPTPDPTPTPAPTQAPGTAEEATPTATSSASPHVSFTPAPTAAAPTPTAAPGAPLTVEVPVSFSFALQEIEDCGAFQNTSLRLTYAAPAEGGFEFRHVRYGHGVGMSQRGAQQMAYEGKSFVEILAHYYPGGTLSPVDYISPESAALSSPPPAIPGTVATGTVQGEAVNVRTGASSATKSLGKLDVGTSVTLTGLFNDWYQIVYPATGVTAYVHSDYIAPSGSGVIASGHVASSAVNLRSGPGTSHATLGQLSKTTPVGIYGIENGWYKLVVLATGQEGYMLKKYVTVTEKAAGVLPAAQSVTATPVPSAALSASPAAQTATPAASITPVPTPTPAPSPTPTPVPGPYTAEGAINAGSVNIRKGASTATNSLGRLPKGEALGIYEKIGSWYRVKVLASGTEGYVYAKYVTMTPVGGNEAHASAGTLNASSVNLRKGPATTYTSLGRLSRGTKVSVLGSSGSWYRVRVSDTGTEGYVFAKYITVASQNQPTGTKQGIVTALINLRTAPTVDDSSRVLMTISKGEIVTVHSSANGWCFITYRGTTGYCIASCVQIG